MSFIIAQNRFGYGAKLYDAHKNKFPSPQEYLKWQIENYQARIDFSKMGFEKPLASPNIFQMLVLLNPNEVGNEEKTKNERQTLRQNLAVGVNIRTVQALNSPTPFMERLVHFWANHFAISTDNLRVAALAPQYEFEAIRPNINKSFFELCMAAETHIAMLIYLNAARSIGPNSIFAQRVKARGKEADINENLAREIMELHTISPESGYSQTDVTEFARAMTGITIMTAQRKNRPNAPNVEIGQAYFENDFHEDGRRKILGKPYSQSGFKQFQAILADFCASPFTANHIATKLARHFAGDSPPQELVSQLKNEFLRTKGDLPSLYRILIASPYCWQQEAVKFKSPWEWLLSAFNASSIKQINGRNMLFLSKALGETVWQPKSPKGFDDVSIAWASPDALLKRADIAWQIAKYADLTLQPVEIAKNLAGENISKETIGTISRAESPLSAFALFLMSKEMLRR